MQSVVCLTGWATRNATRFPVGGSLMGRCFHATSVALKKMVLTGIVVSDVNHKTGNEEHVCTRVGSEIAHVVYFAAQGRSESMFTTLDVLIGPPLACSSNCFGRAHGSASKVQGFDQDPQEVSRS